MPAPSPLRSIFGAASAEVLRLFHPGVYTLRLESVGVPSRLKLSNIGARSALGDTGGGMKKIIDLGAMH